MLERRDVCGGHRGATDPTHQTHPLGGVRSAQRGLEKRRILDRAHLLLAQAEVHHLLLRHFGFDVRELGDGPVEPVALFPVGERSVTLANTQATRIKLAHANLKIAGIRLQRMNAVAAALGAIDRVARDTVRADDIEHLAAHLLRGDLLGLVGVRFEDDPSLLLHHAAVLPPVVVAISRAVATHDRLPSRPLGPAAAGFT